LDRYVYQNSAGDFLDQIKPLLPNLRYARWIRYPVPIVVRGESHEWITLVTQGIREWSRYIPLAVVHRPQQAGIEIIQSQDLQGISGSATPEFFWGEDGSLQQRVQILISAASMAEVPTITRHELGHALGLWGHSPDSSDLMYGGLHAQATGGKRILKVAQIGPRELNTLKRIYEQPTLIGERL
jgi:predicted Zn-dependent protease